METVPRDRWRSYFDNVSRCLGNRLVEIEAEGLDFGRDVETLWLPLGGITFDPKDDVLEVVTPELDHLIHHPSEIVVERHGVEIACIRVRDSAGNEQVLRFRAPLELPPPEGA